MFSFDNLYTNINLLFMLYGRIIIMGEYVIFYVKYNVHIMFI